MKIADILKDCLVFDIETSAHYPDGREISIMADFDGYVEHAICKWIGIYSYKYNKEYYLQVSEHYDLIKSLFADHDILIGFNNEEFDYPIIKNNGFVEPDKYYIQVDCMKIMGASSFKDKHGFKYKGRGELMDYKFKNNKLATMAEVMELDFQKGDIDYQIFAEVEWTQEQKVEIVKYLKNDVMATKQIFDKLWDYWLPFTELLDYKNIKNLSWIRSSIASLIYKSACFIMQTEPTYGDGGGQAKEQMGGNVIDPVYEEARDVWYIDFTSLYPHIFCMFNLFDETQEVNGRHVWHGNEIFKAKGYYNVKEQHILSKAVQDKLKERIELKKNDPKNPMVYTIKIWLNGLYGIIRSAIFEKVHNENGGWDCCWLGQQIQKLTEDMMAEFGFESIYGDTDSLMVVAKEERFNNEAYVRECLQKVIDKILGNVPFPVETYNIDIEKKCTYMMFPFSDQPVVDEETGKNIKKGNRLVKVRKGKKKNYMYLYEENGETKVKLVGLPIMKDNATKLGIKIYKEVLLPKILENKRAKFSKEMVDGQIEDYLKNPEIMKLIAREFKVKPSATYAKESQIQAQISDGYFEGSEGIINLIKNKKVGKAGKGNKYCTVEEALEANLTVEDLDLEKVYNELEPFILHKEALTKV